MQPQPANNERNVILFTSAGHFCTHFFELMFPTLAVSFALDTGIPFGEVLGWSFAGYLLFGLGALPFGYLGDRLGARPLIVTGVAGMGVFSIAAGESGHGSALTICLAGMGLFASIYHPVGMSLISRTSRRRGRALAINGIFGNLAIALTPIITASLCAAYGWRMTYSIVGYIACAVAVGIGFLPIDETANEEVGRDDEMTSSSSNSLGLLGLLLVAAALAGISYRGNTAVQPAYFAEHVQIVSFGAATTIVYLFGTAGQYLGGALADRYDLRWLYFGFHAISLPALIAMTVLTDLPLIAAAMLFVFFSLGMQPIENSLLAYLTPVRWRSTAYGLKFVLTFGVGALAVRLVAWAQRDGDLGLALLCLAFVILLLLGVVAVLLYASANRSFVQQADEAATTV